MLSASYVVVHITREFWSPEAGITPTKFKRSKFTGNMHNYIWCPYYLPSFMKFCSVVLNFVAVMPLWTKISRNILLKQLVSATPLKLLNRISWNLVGSKGIFRGVALTSGFSSIFREILVQRGITATKFRRSKFPDNMHNCIWSEFHDTW
jgi:hypothetical protein